MAPASRVRRLARRIAPLGAISVLGCTALTPHPRDEAFQRIVARLALPAARHRAPGAHGTVYGDAALAAVSAPAALTSPLPGPSRVLLASEIANERVREAFVEKDAPLRAAFAARGLPYLSGPLLLRAFKRERELEAWVREPGSARYVLLRTYRICTLGAGRLGPKLRRGDEQVPEGFYHITELNPNSHYFLSLRLDYPNAADLGRADGAPGGDIYVHGGCRTAGCLPLTNDAIKELYWLVAQERALGQGEVPIDIYPTRLDDASMAQLARAFPDRPALLAFWRNLKQGYDAFESTHRLPSVQAMASGRYEVGSE